jgi:hypothetical protein
MAVENAVVSAMQMPFGAQTTEVTVSPQALCHYITDDELERLGDMRKEPVMEICLCTIGAFLGALIPALQTLAQFNDDPAKVTMWGLMTLMIAFATFAVAVVSGVLWYQRSKTHKSMVENIRERPRAPVRLANDRIA